MTSALCAMVICDESSRCLSSLRSCASHLSAGPLASSLVHLRKSMKSSSSASSSSSSSSSSPFPEQQPEQDSNNYSTFTSSPSPLPSCPPPPLDALSPFLGIIRSPTVAGPQTLTALKSVITLLQPLRRESKGTATGDDATPHGVPICALGSPGVSNVFFPPSSSSSSSSSTSSPPLSTYSLASVIDAALSCKYVQTDPSSDECVEIALADLLCLCVGVDRGMARHYGRRIRAKNYCEEDEVDKGNGRKGRRKSGGGGLREGETSASYVSAPQTSDSSSPPPPPPPPPPRPPPPVLPHALVINSFHSIFVTRNSFVHSPAMCHHAERALEILLLDLFQGFDEEEKPEDRATAKSAADKLGGAEAANYAKASNYPNQPLTPKEEHSKACCGVFHFLANQLLHTPLLPTDSASSSSSSSSTSSSSTSSSSSSAAHAAVLGQAQASHDRTRVLCLRLLTCCVRGASEGSIGLESNPTLLHVLRSSIFKSLVFTGQAVGMGLSTEVLSETCSAVRVLWSNPPLRRCLKLQFEAVFNALYLRVLLRLIERPMPKTAAESQVLDSSDLESSVVLESLVDVLSLCVSGPSDLSGPSPQLNALSALYVNYDCDVATSDVMTDLVGALAQCAGSFDEQAIAAGPNFKHVAGFGGTGDEAINSSSAAAAAAAVAPSSTPSDSVAISDSDVLAASASRSSQPSLPTSTATATVKALLSPSPPPPPRSRPVPRKLRLLCTEALVACVSSLLDVPDFVEYGDGGIEAAMTTHQSGSTPTPTAELLSKKRRKGLLRTGAALFNDKPTKGILFLQSTKALPSNPLPPETVAAFLRTGISVGLDKAAVGAFLGEAGKSEQQQLSAKSKCHDCETAVFHQLLLKSFCNLFHFHSQPLLRGLRMFLAAFRLPGEAQQIDRIIQAFAESCGTECSEVLKGGIFSSNPKKACDTVYLLAFSIIMLNTDLHNPNIRPDRKMTIDAFVKNNSDYGTEITDEPLPRAFLTEIYESIRDEEILTRSDGPKGDLTVDRWKDAVRAAQHTGRDALEFRSPTEFDHLIINREVFAQIWRPIMSAACANLLARDATPMERKNGGEICMMLGKGAGMYGMTEVLDGIVANLCCYSGLLGAPNTNSTPSLEQHHLCWIEKSGVQKGVWSIPIHSARQSYADVDSDVDAWGDRSTDEELFKSSAGKLFGNSVSKQIACCSAFQMGVNLGFHMVEVHSWKFIVRLLMSLRELKVVGKKLLKESDDDLLSELEREEFRGALLSTCTSKLAVDRGENRTKSKGLLSAIGSLFFGGGGGPNERENDCMESASSDVGGYQLGFDDVDYLWDLSAESSDEEEETVAVRASSSVPSNASISAAASSGDVILPDDVAPETVGVTIDSSIARDTPPLRMITSRIGTRRMSRRAALRRQLTTNCKFHEFVSVSKFLPLKALTSLITALSQIAKESGVNVPAVDGVDSQNSAFGGFPAGGKSASSDASTPVSSFQIDEYVLGGGKRTAADLVKRCAASVKGKAVTPGSAAFAEVLLCEIALRNRDRMTDIWPAIEAHYKSRLNGARHCTFGLEKCASGLLRIIYRMADRSALMERLLLSLKLLTPPKVDLAFARSLDAHIMEGIWRLCSLRIGVLSEARASSWNAIFDSIELCVREPQQPQQPKSRSNSVTTEEQAAGSGEPPFVVAKKILVSSSRSTTSDWGAKSSVLIKALKTLHLLLHAPELKQAVPYGIVKPICALIRNAAGVGGTGSDSSREEWDFRSKVSIAGLDLLMILHSRLGDGLQSHFHDIVLSTCWTPIIEGFGEIGSNAGVTNVRQHALTLLTEAIVDRHGRAIPPSQLLSIIQNVCIPVASSRITDIAAIDPKELTTCLSDVNSELQLAVSTIFKPLFHHLQSLMGENGFKSLWQSSLDVTGLLLNNESKPIVIVDVKESGGEAGDTREAATAKQSVAIDIFDESREFCFDYVKNAILVLNACGEDSSSDTQQIARRKIDNMKWLSESRKTDLLRDMDKLQGLSSSNGQKVLQSNKVDSKMQEPA